MSARDSALAQLDRARLPGWSSGQLRHRVNPPADPRDWALAEQIRLGAIKNHLLLNHLIDHYSRRPGRIDPLVRKILVIALYQLRFLTRIPAPAAVDQAVAQARRFGRPHAAGFVNALLRRAVREPDVPLPDRASDPEDYARIVLSHPAELFRRLVALLGVDDAIRFCEHDNAEPPTVVRLFHGVSPDQLAAEGVALRPHERPGMLVVDSARRAVFADWAARGLAQVQDPTAADVVAHLGILPGQRICDRCAGLGTKTLQIRDDLGDRGWIVAIDPAEPRTKALRSLVAARNISNIAIVQGSWLRDIVDLKPPCFDRILIDAPCSNSGVLARRAEARHSQTAAAIESVSSLQDRILKDTAPYLVAGGLLIYSTCSVWPEENQQRVDRFLSKHREFDRLESRSTLPSFDSNPARYHDGGFWCLLQRR